jgi:hypothetical protein
VIASLDSWEGEVQDVGLTSEVVANFRERFERF